MAHMIRRDTYPSPGALGFIYPTPRTYNATTAGTRPCGVAAVSATRDYVPLNGGNLWLLSQAKVENIQLNFANSEDPTEQTDFDNLGMAMTGLTTGDMCIPLPDFTDLGLMLGDKITLQVAYALEANYDLVLRSGGPLGVNSSLIGSDSDASSTDGAAATVTVTSSASTGGKVSPRDGSELSLPWQSWQLPWD
ncbi:hypothetical protein I204_06953 [Kwoniella mangroviensis CBS 8886]|nr:hypothetical protein I204_06953 [Kwoniella mangroviensis CBS 8886]